MTGTKEWKAWVSMRNRCTLKCCHRYKNYGGRGIKVCDRWIDSFENFYEDMGNAPVGTSLDRIDVNSDYSPGNCRWATKDQQYANKTTTKLVLIHGMSVPLVELVRLSGIKHCVAYSRVFRYGWEPERAFPNLKPESLHQDEARLSTERDPDSRRIASRQDKSEP